MRRADRFRFDYIFRSLTPQQLKARCEALMKCVEKENKELRQRKNDEARRSEKQVTSSVFPLRSSVFRVFQSWWLKLRFNSVCFMILSQDSIKKF